jgi:hypothetical protein
MRLDRSGDMNPNHRTGIFTPGRLIQATLSGCPRISSNAVQLGKTGTDTNFLLLEIGCLSQRFAVLTEQCWN